jgi:hypothetical protein
VAQQKRKVADMGKACLSVGVAVLAGLVLLSIGINPAHARSDCYYIAHDPVTGNMIADGAGWAAKKKWACNRELERKFRKHQVGRGVSCGKAW